MENKARGCSVLNDFSGEAVKNQFSRFEVEEDMHGV